MSVAWLRSSSGSSSSSSGRAPPRNAPALPNEQKKPLKKTRLQNKSSQQHTVRDTWTELSSGVYVATIAFAYLCFVMLLLFFVALVAFQSAVTAELGLPPAPPGVVNVVPAAALRNPFAAAHHAKYHDPAAHSPFGGGAVSPPPGYEGAARIAAFRPGAGGSGGGSPMAATASAMPPPQVAMMAMPTPMVGSPLAMNQDSAL